MPTTTDRDEGLLRERLSAVVRRRVGPQSAIAALRRQPLERATSFGAELLTIETTEGARLQIYLKDFAHSSLPKPGLEQRRRRERLVYRDLLARAGLDTAEYYGSVWDERQGRYWLLMEFVPGVELRMLGFEDWVEAAAWLGRLHGSFIEQAHRLDQHQFLIRHDAAFFASFARGAQQAVPYFSQDLVDRLAAVLEEYDRIIDVMVGQPLTLVHGSYRPQNIMVDKEAQPTRIAPIDWELAAIGAPLYDLAFIADGFKLPRLQVMLAAYRRRANEHNLHLPDEPELILLLNCFRLHKIVKSLSDSAMMGFKHQTVEKLVGMAEDVGRLVLK